MRGLKRGLIGGLLLGIILFFLPDSWLGAVTVGTGLASVLPAAAPPLGMTARLLLSAIAFLVGFSLTFWLVRRSRPAWDIDDSTDLDEPLPAYEQMVVSPAVIAAPVDDKPAASIVAPVADDREINARLSRIEASLADVAAQIARAVPASDDNAAVLARVEALETQISERLEAIDARLAVPNIDESGADQYRPGLRTSKRVSRTLANIRRSIDGA